MKRFRVGMESTKERGFLLNEVLLLQNSTTVKLLYALSLISSRQLRVRLWLLNTSSLQVRRLVPRVVPLQLQKQRPPLLLLLARVVM